MADKTIFDLTELTAANVTTSDVFIVGDDSAVATKKLSVSKLATLLNTTFSAGDVLYHDGTNWARLAKGTANQVLTMNSGATAPEWAAPADPPPSWVTIGLYEPTSDATTWAIATGLSGYKAIRARVLISCSAGSADLTISGRVTSGTWRTIYTTTTQTTAADDVLMLAAEIHNWNGSDGTIGRKPIFASGGDDTATLTASGDFTPAGALEAGIGQIGSTNGGEAWDEIRVSVSNGNINGTTASERGWAVLEGILE